MSAADKLCKQFVSISGPKNVGSISIQTVGHYDGIPEIIFRKELVLTSRFCTAEQ